MANPVMYPIINPDDSANVSDLAAALLTNQNDPAAWVWTPFTDWSSEECRNIRYEISMLVPDHTVKFRPALHEGMRGTAMHIVHRDDNPMPPRTSD